MATMIYRRSVTRDDDYETGLFEMVEILHSDWDSINAQIADALEGMIPANLDNDGYVHWDRYEIEKWNDMGYQWRVEEQYAEGAMMSGLLNSEFVQDIKRMYGYPDVPRNKMTSRLYMSFPTEEDEIAAQDNAYEKYPSVFLHEFTNPDDDEVNEANQERADKAVKMLFAVCDYLRNGARPQHMSWRSAGRHWKIHDYQGRTTTSQHFLFTGLSDASYFNTEMFDGHNITFNDYQRAKNDAEWKAHLAYMQTPEGKAEEAERIQRARDLQTAMYEGGYTSYARNDDGSISMWRD
jgi:hypothetical protein